MTQMTQQTNTTRDRASRTPPALVRLFVENPYLGKPLSTVAVLDAPRLLARSTPRKAWRDNQTAKHGLLNRQQTNPGSDEDSP